VKNSQALIDGICIFNNAELEFEQPTHQMSESPGIFWIIVDHLSFSSKCEFQVKLRYLRGFCVKNDSKLHTIFWESRWKIKIGFIDFDGKLIFKKNLENLIKFLSNLQS
jgi:hypothetical protein